MVDGFTPGGENPVTGTPITEERNAIRLGTRHTEHPAAKRPSAFATWSATRSAGFLAAIAAVTQSIIRVTVEFPPPRPVLNPMDRCQELTAHVSVWVPETLVFINALGRPAWPWLEFDIPRAKAPRPQVGAHTGSHLVARVESGARSRRRRRVLGVFVHVECLCAFTSPNLAKV
ncbi:hypothetical protein DFH07DRAFT_773720 [Mycena maculata]|uniref:Uncharacterized protein n=1 Tax=Mycena maculata TaxID=230809 RepID=A0AAD7NBZ1_9AGAR|nr:hypothetical protein DFH07DRAFT_773720 [Mycena maculata]